MSRVRLVRAVRRGAGTAAVLAFAWLIAGWTGLAIALPGLVVAEWRGARAAAGAALVLVIASAVLIVVEAPATGSGADYGLEFATQRPLAAEAGRAAGVLTLVALVVATRRERTCHAPDIPDDDG